MKKLSKLKLNTASILNETEMQNVIGGYYGSGDYARCNKKGCLTGSDCGNNTCVNWSDCPSISTYGRKRCI